MSWLNIVGKCNNFQEPGTKILAIPRIVCVCLREFFKTTYGSNSCPHRSISCAQTEFRPKCWQNRLLQFPSSTRGPHCEMMVLVTSRSWHSGTVRTESEFRIQPAAWLVCLHTLRSHFRIRAGWFSWGQALHNTMFTPGDVLHSPIKVIFWPGLTSQWLIQISKPDWGKQKKATKQVGSDWNNIILQLNAQYNHTVSVKLFHVMVTWCWKMLKAVLVMDVKTAAKMLLWQEMWVAIV